MVLVSCHEKIDEYWTGWITVWSYVKIIFSQNKLFFPTENAHKNKINLQEQQLKRKNSVR